MTRHQLTVHTAVPEGCEDILSAEALEFISALECEFGARRRELLAARVVRQKQISEGGRLGYQGATKSVREGNWRVGATPKDLQDRRVEITGPTDKKMVINALNSGARVFMADFEDANSPTWSNMVEGQANLRAAVGGKLAFTSAEGKRYELKDRPAVLMVRPRGWHLEERHVSVSGRNVDGISASLFDFGLYFHHNAKALMARGSGPYFYLPKLESHLEARLWNDVFVYAQKLAGIPEGTIKATVLIETILAAFEMDEILFELRDHIVGLNAGRWDYLFSIIKKFQARQEVLLPDRGQLTMTAPFMRAYAALLVQTCHRRGAHAMGGMAAFIPSRRDPQINETAMAKVREDKLRESSDGFDGTWVAHPDLVPLAMEVFTTALGSAPNQKHHLGPGMNVSEEDLQEFSINDGRITEAGVRTNISVAIQYLGAWLSGQGAVGINNLMEDAATAEISRAQLWQWVHHPEARLDDSRKVTAELYRALCKEELAKIKQMVGPSGFDSGRYSESAELLTRLVVQDEFAEFLTLGAYALLP